MNNYEEKLIYNYLPKEKWEEGISKLKNGYPVQYIIGTVNFYGYEIDVNESILIPRFETEGLVEKIIQYIKLRNMNEVKILDIGCGSGCIAIALKKELKCEVTALDISKEAIIMTDRNASKNNVKIKTINEDIKEYDTREQYDVIVSNPPYIATNETIDPKTKYEPQNALYAPNEGLYFYDLIIKKSKSLLKPKGIIAFEIGAYQKEQIFEIIDKYYPLSDKICLKDLNNFDRYIFIFMNK